MAEQIQAMVKAKVMTQAEADKALLHIAEKEKAASPQV